MSQRSRYGLTASYRTREGCDVLVIRTVLMGGNVFAMVPVEHIYLSCPEKEEEKG